MVRPPALVLLLAPALALAQDADPPAEVEASTELLRADALVEEGNGLGKIGDFEAAIAKWNQADRLVRRPIHACNIGLAYVRLSFWAQAHYYLGRCKATWSEGPLPGWVETRLKESVRPLQAGNFAQAKIAVSPESASWTVSFLGDESLTGGRTLWAPYGTHTITAEGDGFRQQSANLIVGDKTPAPLALALSPLPPEPAPLSPEPTPTPADSASSRADLIAHTQPDPLKKVWLYSGISSGAATAGLGVLALVFRSKASAAANRAVDPNDEIYDNLNNADRNKAFEAENDTVEDNNRNMGITLAATSLTAGLTGYFLFKYFTASPGTPAISLLPTLTGGHIAGTWRF